MKLMKQINTYVIEKGSRTTVEQIYCTQAIYTSLTLIWLINSERLETGN